jgi:2-methylcitrate dehydratase PrpD
LNAIKFSQIVMNDPTGVIAVPTAFQFDRAEVTRSFAEHALSYNYAGLSEKARRIAIHCIVDWYAVTLAATADQTVQCLVADALSEGSRPLATAAGCGQKMGLYQAALINGTAAHLLDYDDVNLAITGHPSAVVFSALLPLAESLRCSGAALLAAFVAGYETACRVGKWLGPAHYERGFHATATVGVLGAAAACANLLGMDNAKTACALGLAATQAGGLKAMFGTMAKPLHAGLAARNGLMAACLAQRGFEGGQTALDAAQGYAEAFSPSPDLAAAFAEPDGGLHLFDRLFKYHASCYGTHAGIECARTLASEYGVKLENIERTQIKVHQSNRGMCSIADPRNATEAKFSLRLNIALALLGIDTGDLAAYTHVRLRQENVIALRDRLEVVFVDEVQMMEAEMTVHMRDHGTVVIRKNAGLPEPDIDIEETRLRQKFMTLTAPVVGSQAASRLLEELFDIATQHDVAGLAHSIGVTPSKDA